MQKNKVFKKLFSVLCSCVVVMSFAVPAFADDTQLPDLITPTSTNKKMGLFQAANGADSGKMPTTFIAMSTKEITEAETYCLNQEASSPAGTKCREVKDISELSIAGYDAAVLEVLLNYPMKNNAADFPVLNGADFADKTAEDKEYFGRQVAIWYYQSLVDTSGKSTFEKQYINSVTAYGDEKSQKLLAELMDFVDKVVDKKVTLPTENTVKVDIPSTSELTLNDTNNCYESQEFAVKTKGCLGGTATVTQMNLPDYMTAVDCTTGENLKENDTVDRFIVRVAEKDVDKLNAATTVPTMKVAVAYELSSYKLYINDIDNVRTYQDVGVIVKTKKTATTEVAIAATVKQKAPEKPTPTPTTPTKEETTVTPQTGDNSKALGYLTVVTLCLGGAFFAVKKKVKNNSHS